jgi:hypothetical protein
VGLPVDGELDAEITIFRMEPKPPARAEGVARPTVKTRGGHHSIFFKTRWRGYRTDDLSLHIRGDKTVNACEDQVTRLSERIQITEYMSPELKETKLYAERLRSTIPSLLRSIGNHEGPLTLPTVWFAGV